MLKEHSFCLKMDLNIKSKMMMVNKKKKLSRIELVSCPCKNKSKKIKRRKLTDNV
jgi:hypothetical protein